MSIGVSKLMGTNHTIILVEECSFESFKQLVNRATNTWPDAPAEIKTFADQITNDGVVLQDYASQDTSKKQRPDSLSQVTDPQD